ncbi:MAG TPA: glycoside hydrolase family 3 N-terminal domain-containing protein [Ktedonobacteraceae bacterium]|nr:glycoside hydrolase family 3 N-terminal domain-containing protein [Ktedonobacteraceae bacterium]
MKADNVEFPGTHNGNNNDADDTQKLPVLKSTGMIGTLEKNSFATDSSKTSSEDARAKGELSLCSTSEVDVEQAEVPCVDIAVEATELTSVGEEIGVAEEAPPPSASDEKPLRFIEPLERSRPVISRGRAILLVAFLVIVILNAVNLGSTQFLGPQGWAFVLGEPASNGNKNPLTAVQNILHHTTPTTGTKGKSPLTPAQYINLLIQNMTLEQKLGQMMIVQFVGPSYSLDLSTMISQYNVGAVLIFAANDNIQSKPQLKGLIQQMQSGSISSTGIPMAVAIDQEGGTVDRLINLDGPRPSATSIGETGNPINAYNEGVRDASDLAYYGFNLNLAPVVDVNNAYNPQMYLRTFGTNATTVTQMAEAYLKGLQKSGKVLGTLKHFPGLGDVTADPHVAVPHLNRSLSNLMKIDWAPYRAMIQQGDVYSVMVTHEIVEAVDSTIPSSLSYKLVTDILRNQLGFQGVIMTDSLTMEGILAYYTEAQAAVLAVEAGDDVLMGASTPGDVAAMITGLKQAVNAGQISQQRIDDSVRRILTMKYAMGLLHIPAN